MQKRNWTAFLTLAALVGLVATASAAQPSCDANAKATAVSAIDAACPCGGITDPTSGAVTPWKNHGQYVKCVTKARKAQGKANGLKPQCLKEVLPCAANSTCGKVGAVACLVTTGTCVGDPNSGDLVAEGTCDNDATKPCDTDADCSQSSCQIADSDADCTAIGGSSATGTCCVQ
jgi:hypothetical protein